MSPIRPKICILVTNDIANDPRVTKQACSSVKAGYETLVLGWSTDESPLKGSYSVTGKPYRLLIGYRSHLTGSIGYLNLKSVVYNWYIIFLRLKDYFPGVMSKLAYAYAGFKLPLRLVLRINKKNRKKFNLTGFDFTQKNVKLKADEDISTVKRSFFSKAFDYTIRNVQAYRLLIHYYRSLTRFFIEEGVRYKPDVVHANDLDTLIAGYFIKKKTKAKLIYDAHEIWTKQGLDLPKIFIWFFSFVEFFLIRTCDAFISVNQSIVDEIKKINLFIPKIPVEVIYNCPPYEKVNRKKNLKVEVLYQGRYSQDRGLEELAQVASFIRDNTIIRFRGIGDKRQIDNVKEMVNQGIKSRHRIVFDKPVNMKNLVKAASRSDIGVVPYKPTNINNKFCLPNKIFEYIMAGLALVVSDLPELSTIVKKYKNGITVHPNDPKSIAKGINRLVNNKKLLDRMQKNSLEASRSLNWQSQEVKLLNLYKQLCKN